MGDLDTSDADLAAGSPAVAAWSRLRETLQRQREELLAHELCEHPLLRAQGLYYLQSMEAVAFNMYLAPRQLYPALYVHSMFMPLELSWGLPNPDFVNHIGFVDGARTYRIHGNRAGDFWSTLQVLRGFWGDEVQDMVDHVDFDDLPATADGSFEIFLGPNPPADTGGKRWVKLDPNAPNMMLTLREVFYDWERDRPIEVHIEALDREQGAPITYDEAELAARIDRAHRYSIYNFNFAMGQAREPEGGAPLPRNRFIANDTAGQHGGNPLAAYSTMLYDLGPDEALILEMTAPQARYWGVQMGSVWAQTADYSYHQSSINGAQAVVDADGAFRAVIAIRDPGVPNWLDPVGVPIGFVLFRWYRATAAAIPPSVRKVALADIRNHLPAETPQIAPDQRAREIDARRRASLRRYGQ